jgi:hypothetical protein
MTLLEEVFPHHHFSERHERFVAAPRSEAYGAVTTVTLGRLPLTRLLFRVRSGPAYVFGKQALPTGKNESFLAQMMASGFVHLAEDPGHEVVFGAVGQFWKPSGRLSTVHDLTEFADFNKPGLVKAAMNLRAVDHGDGSLLETETRVLATDAASRRAFAIYWTLIRLPSGAIRREWLRAAARVAEGE